MIPVLCHGCGQTGKVASIPSDLVCLACKSDDIDLDDRTAAIMGDPDMPAGLLSNDQPEMGLLGDMQKVTESIRCSTCFHQFTQQVTDPSAPMLPCPKCGADTTTAAGTTTALRVTASEDEMVLVSEDGTILGGPVEVDSPEYDALIARENAGEGRMKGLEWVDQDDAYFTGRTSAADTRLPEEIKYQQSIEQKPQSQLTGEEEIDLARLRRQQRGPIDGSNIYGGSNPYSAKVAQITEGVLASNPGMDRRTAARVAKETIRRYPKVLG